MQYLVTFTQYHEYWVEADTEKEAEDIGHKEFCHDMRSPIANTNYDEVSVEPWEDEDAD